MSDQCLAKGLIPDSVYKRVLESGGTSNDKARTLVLALKTTTETDNGCLEILLDILEKQLPYATKKKLLSEIRKELTEKANTTNTVQHLPSEELPRESALLKSSLLGKFEDAIRQHERACAEKSALEQKLKTKAEEHKILKQNTEASKNQASSGQSGVADRITKCEHEIKAIKARVEELAHTIEEQGMNVKRDRIIVELKTEKMLAASLEKVKEDMRVKECNFASIIREKDLKIKELELDAKERKESTRAPNVVPSDILKQLHIERL